MQLDDVIKTKITDTWPSSGEKYVGYAQTEVDKHFQAFDKYKNKRVRDIPESEFLEAMLEMIVGHEAFVPHMYRDSEGLVTVGIGTLIDTASCKNRMYDFDLRVGDGGAVATRAQRDADWRACKYKSGAAASTPASDFESVTTLRISEDEAKKEAMALIRSHRDAMFNAAFAHSAQHADVYLDYPVLAWMIMVDMAFNLGNHKFNKWKSMHAAVAEGEWETAAKESFVRGVGYKPLAVRYCSLMACADHEPDTSGDDVDDHDEGSDTDVEIGDEANEGITLEKVIDVPSMSQGNPTNSKSVYWCGRTSASMVYNYYKAIEGKQDEFIVNCRTRRDLVYPDGSPAAPGYNLSEPLLKAKDGWGSSWKLLFGTEGRSLPLTREQARDAVQQIVDSIDNNNPVVAYTSISRNEDIGRHIVVISGYREKDGDLWLHFDDPATMRFGAGRKGEALGPDNIEIISSGVWQETGARYWLRVNRLFEANTISKDPNDLWCDYPGKNGFACWINTRPTEANDRVQSKRTQRVALPVDLGLGLGVSEANIDGYYKHVEVDYAGGYFPLGANSVWHGGVHIRGKEGATVHAIADGEIVAARLGADEDTGSGHYGSKNFILVKHQISGKALNTLTAKPQRVGFTASKSWNVRQQPTTSGARLGTLQPADQLQIVNPKTTRADGYDWYQVKVLRSAAPGLTGRTGWVGYRASAFDDLYERQGRNFDPGATIDFFSLYMHLHHEEHDAESEALKDIPWLLKTVRTETTAEPSDATISGSVGAGGRNLRADVRTVQQLLTDKGVDVGVVDGLVGSKTIGGIRTFQSEFLSSPDGRVDVGGTTWRKLIAATGAGEGEDALVVDPEVLGKLAGGNVVEIGRSVRAGQKLWTMGQHGSPGYRTWLLHLEVFSAENLFPDWDQVMDEDPDFNMDAQKIVAMIDQDNGWLDSDTVISSAEIKRFYREDHDAATLRYYACKFCSEWGVDLETAISRMKGVYFTYGMHDKLEPYNFYRDLEAVAEVPDRHHWHYNPIAVVEKLSPLGDAIRTTDPGVTEEDKSDDPTVDPNLPDPEDALAGEMYYVKRGGRTVPHFCQGSAPWGDRILGSSKSIASRGCAITATAMILNYYGRDVNPGTLDAYLDDHDGYAGDNVKWLVAMKCEEGAGGPKLKYGERITDAGKIRTVLNGRIAANRPTLARVDYGDDNGLGWNHFVVIVGRDAHGRYIMNDPGYRDGNGVAHPEDGNIIGFNVNRRGGYTIVQLDLIDPDGEPDPVELPDETDLPPDPDPLPTSTEKYGGYELQYGDKDKTKLWGGRTRSVQASYVEELQKDLVACGYWISNPKDYTHKGMNADGAFGSRVKAAVRLFQRESELPETGRVDPATAEKIKEKVAGDTRRPGREPRNCPGAEFFQLPPSPYYGRYGDIPVDSAGVILDIWGTKQTIDCIRSTGEEWKRLGYGPFLVGDISLHDGGYFSPHSSHRDGTGVDIAGGSWCDIRKSYYDKEESLRLARVFAKYGAKRILFNCKYVIDNCEQVKSCKSHHHHYHLDTIDKPISQPKSAVECLWCHKDVYAACDYDGKRARTSGQLSK